jgi:hypothetical protein
MADFEKSTVPKAPDLQKRLEAALPGRTIVFGGFAITAISGGSFPRPMFRLKNDGRDQLDAKDTMRERSVAEEYLYENLKRTRSCWPRRVGQRTYTWQRKAIYKDEWGGAGWQSLEVHKLNIPKADRKLFSARIICNAINVSCFSLSPGTQIAAPA